MNTELKPQAGGIGSDGAIRRRRFGWRRLQIFAAIGVLVSFVVPMVIELSLEPFLLAMAAPFAIGLLLMMKWPRVAAIWLGFVSLAVLLFSLPFLGEALTHPESPADFIPLSLFALGSVVGAAGAMPAFREIGAGRVQSKGPRRIATSAAGLLVAATALSVVTTVGLDNVEPQAGDLLIATEDFAFTPTDVSTDPGTIAIAVTNRDNTRHTFTIAELGVDLSLAPGTTQRVTFTAEPGTYNFFCNPHPDMQGRLVVG
jgi:plastocyanin